MRISSQMNPLRHPLNNLSPGSVHPSSHNVPLIISDHCHMCAEGTATQFIIYPKTQTQTDKRLEEEASRTLIMPEEDQLSLHWSWLLSNIWCWALWITLPKKCPVERTAHQQTKICKALWRERERIKKLTNYLCKIHPHPAPISPTHMTSLLNMSP